MGVFCGLKLDFRSRISRFDINSLKCFHKLERQQEFLPSLYTAETNNIPRPHSYITSENSYIVW